MARVANISVIFCKLIMKRKRLRKMVVVVQLQLLPNSLWPHQLQHDWLPCSPLPPCACSNSCLLSQWSCACVLSSFSSIQLLATLQPQPDRCFCPWDFPGKSSSGGSSGPRDQTHVSCIDRWILCHWHHLERL